MAGDSHDRTTSHPYLAVSHFVSSFFEGQGVNTRLVRNEICDHSVHGDPASCESAVVVVAAPHMQPEQEWIWGLEKVHSYCFRNTRNHRVGIPGMQHAGTFQWLLAYKSSHTTCFMLQVKCAAEARTHSLLLTSYAN